MHLARLIFQWSRALRHAIVSIDRDGTKQVDSTEPCLVGTSPLDAFALAGDLAGLIDELIIEDVAFSALDPLVLPEFDSYWRITLDFLNIAIAHWPDILAESHLVDAARRRVMLVDKQIARIEAGLMRGPVIAIGSTGTNRGTARLLAAIARAPKGAIVLPGLDRDLDETAWQHIGIAGDETRDPAFGHPQAALCRLLAQLKIARDSVIALGDIEPRLATRARFVSEALRPAETTDHWQEYRSTTTDAEIEAALADVALIEAADEREEALALAIAMRQILEEPGKTAALVTPDRTLARRVAAELARFGITIDDSAGEPLSATPYGNLARLTALCAETLAGEDIVALLAHPLVHLGLPRSETERLAPLVEIGLLRQERPLTAFASMHDAIVAARSACAERFAHPAQKRITDADWAKLEDLCESLAHALAPMRQLKGLHELKEWIAAHRLTLESATRSEDAVSRGEDYEELHALFDEVGRCSLPELTFDAEGYLAFLSQAAAGIALRRQRRTHPRLKIFGLLEARLMPADLMLLGGLDETVWPPEARSDVFLNRPMRAALGLSPPERKIGQTAHDFTMAMGAPKVIMSRAAKRDGGPAVASRFVQRLAAVGGAAFKACRARGDNHLALTRALDRPRAGVVIKDLAAKRPMPRPPLDLRPTRLSVTRIETLRRDPYAIYAEFILGLVPLPDFAASITPRIMGTAIHDVLANFCQHYPNGPLPPDAEANLSTMLRSAFADEFSDPEFCAFTWPRIKGAAAFYLDFEAARRPLLARIDVEIEGRLSIPLADGSTFILSAKADRLEYQHDGRMNLIDYKTGTPPGIEEVRVGFAPQLTLEAAMAQRGAFGVAAGSEVAQALYVKLGGKNGGEERVLDFNRKSKSNEKAAPPQTVGDVAEEHFSALIGLLNQFREESTPYPPRPFPKFAAKYGAYDHLARVKEWSLGRDDSA
jgi:ATP-dependent helicase/nuclease subunit B